jgi:drug/metabolite transporter (DMT)-like permease
MRAVQVIGAILIATGLYILVASPSYSSDKSLFKVGQVEAKIQQDRQIPPWVGGAALAAGVVLMAMGFRKA